MSIEVTIAWLLPCNCIWFFFVNGSTGSSAHLAGDFFEATEFLFYGRIPKLTVKFFSNGKTFSLALAIESVIDKLESVKFACSTWQLNSFKSRRSGGVTSAIEAGCRLNYFWDFIPCLGFIILIRFSLICYWKSKRKKLFNWFFSRIWPLNRDSTAKQRIRPLVRGFDR